MMPKTKRMYLAPYAYKWDALQSEETGSLKVGNTRALGFTPIYESYQDFKQDYPDDEPMSYEITLNEGA